MFIPEVIPVIRLAATFRLAGQARPVRREWL